MISVNYKGLYFHVLSCGGSARSLPPPAGSGLGLHRRLQGWTVHPPHLCSILRVTLKCKCALKSDVSWPAQSTLIKGNYMSINGHSVMFKSGGGLILVKLTGNGRYGREIFIWLAPERAICSNIRDLMNYTAINLIYILSIPPGRVFKLHNTNISPFKGHRNSNMSHE